MNTTRMNRLPIRNRAALCIACALMGMTAATVMAAKPPSDVQVRYEKERARCLSGESGQAQDTCLKEAGAARDAAIKGQLNDGDGKLRKNAKERCEVLVGDDRRDCIARIRNAPNTSESGSVKGGGIIRESVTIETGPAASVPAR